MVEVAHTHWRVEAQDWLEVKVVQEGSVQTRSAPKTHLFCVQVLSSKYLMQGIGAQVDANVHQQLLFAHVVEFV